MLATGSPGMYCRYSANSALNPWAEFNISGQFICETFGLMAPAMPQTAARIGRNYTGITVDGEPAPTGLHISVRDAFRQVTVGVWLTVSGGSFPFLRTGTKPTLS